MPNSASRTAPPAMRQSYPADSRSRRIVSSAAGTGTRPGALVISLVSTASYQDYDMYGVFPMVKTIYLVQLAVLIQTAAVANDNPDPAAVERGRKAFIASCGFCHGNDATGNRAPDLD